MIRARALGWCFGVRDTVAAARAEPDPGSVTVLGQLVHNADVTGELAARGFRSSPGLPGSGESVATPGVLVTAHGASDRQFAGLRAAGLRVVDTTCPLVRRVQDAAKRFAADGRFVVLIGVPGHAEAVGVVGDLPAGRFEVVRDESAVRKWPHGRIGVACQSTTDPDTAAATLAAVRAANPAADVAFADTVCKPTRDRQAAVRELCSELRAAPGGALVVVVGGTNSHNTGRLAALCEAEGATAVRVTGAGDLDPAAFAGRRAVGLTAGTSTPDAAVDAVEARLRGFPAG